MLPASQIPTHLIPLTWLLTVSASQTMNIARYQHWLEFTQWHWKQWQTLFSWAPKSLQMVTAAMKLKDTCSLKEKEHIQATIYDRPRQHTKNQRHYFANKGPSIQSYGFFSSHVWMWESDHKENWALKNWCFWTLVLQDSWESLVPGGDQTSQS